MNTTATTGNIDNVFLVENLMSGKFLPGQFDYDTAKKVAAENFGRVRRLDEVLAER